MTEPTFREIQLTRKQLFFIFVASVVFAVIVFLLGVSLGRRLPTTEAGRGSGTAVTENMPPEDMPPATVLTPEDQQYANELQGRGPVPPATPVPPPSAEAKPVDPLPGPGKPEAASSSAPTVTAPAGTTAAPASGSPQPPAAAGGRAAGSGEGGRSAAPAEGAAAPAAGGWFVQIDAFRSRENADARVRQLKTQGHAAFVSPGGSLFRVRVGPFSDRAEADKSAAALRQDGYRPSITR
jgi:DedD protein